MALLTSFELLRMDRNSVHAEAEATYSIFDHNGHRFIQFDSYGSKTRDLPGKKSQTIQLDENSARKMFDILRSHFDF